jgi:hypothetical protein
LIWQQEVNGRGIRIGNTTYGVNITMFDIGSTYGATLNMTRRITQGEFGDFKYILGSCVKLASSHCFFSI